MRCAFVCLGVALFMAGILAHQLFAADERHHHPPMDIISLSRDFIRQTTVIQPNSPKESPQDSSRESWRESLRADAPEDSLIPGVLIHPVEGYIEFEHAWCFSTRYSDEDYQAQISVLCHRLDGRMRGEWCAENVSENALFSASFGTEGSACQAGGIIAVIHAYRPLYSSQDKKWQSFATIMGYQ